MAKYRVPNIPESDEPSRVTAQIVGVRDHHTGAATGTAAVSTAVPGVYSVQLEGCPRQYIDSGMPAGPEAEAVAKDRYLASMLLGLRHRDKLVVKLDA